MVAEPVGAALSRAEEKGALEAAAKGMAQFVYAKTTINIRTEPFS